MTSDANSCTSWREIPDDADALGFGEITRFEIRINESLTHFYALKKQKGEDLTDDWSWAQVAEAASVLKLGETLTFKMTNNAAQIEDDEDMSPASIFQLTLRATFESE
jgi:hypothetical protein